jgi:hypothetical protein
MNIDEFEKNLTLIEQDGMIIKPSSDFVKFT